MLDFLTNFFEQFLQTTALEWLASITGFLCVYLAAKQNILNWPLSIVSVCIYGYIFYQSRLYGDAFLQLYFLGTAIYGWYYWTGMQGQPEPPVRLFSSRQMLYTILAILLLAGLLGGFLQKYTDTDVPYIDGFCTATSFVAQFLMTRKIVQNWLLWLFVNCCYIPLYIHKNLFLTAILYVAFAIIAWNGYRSWCKAYDTSLKNNP